MRRSDLEALEFQPDNTNALLAVTGFGEAAPNLPHAVQNPDLYPSLNYSLGPYVAPSYFDPESPVRADLGVSAEFRYRFAPGWVVAGELRHRLAGTIASNVLGYINGGHIFRVHDVRANRDALRVAEATLYGPPTELG